MCPPSVLVHLHSFGVFAALTLLQLFLDFVSFCFFLQWPFFHAWFPGFAEYLLVDCCFCYCGSSLLQRSVCALLVLHHLCVCSAWLAACENARTASGTLHGSNSATGGAVQRWQTFNVTLFLCSISISIFVHLLSFLENLPTRYNDNYSSPTFH